MDMMKKRLPILNLKRRREKGRRYLDKREGRERREGGKMRWVFSSLIAFFSLL